MATKNVIVLERAQHCVSRKNIDPDALKVLSRLRRYDHETYLVGGGVRDLLLGRTPKDFDIATAAHPNEIKKLFRNCILIGRRFRLAHILFGGKIIETSTFRRTPDPVEDPQAQRADYPHHDNTFGTAAEDALRRDFTVNGLFYDAGTFHVIDHVGGLADLKKRRIRSIGDPEVRFREDPVRMIRAIRFAARLGFDIERKTYRALCKHRAEIEKASPARLLEEIYKLFPYGAGQAAVKLLYKSGLLACLLPEVADDLDRTKRGDVRLWRYLEVLDAGLSTLEAPYPPILLGSLLYDAYLHRLAADPAGDSVRRREEIARDLLKPVAVRFGMPKRVFFCLLHMFTEQDRFVAGSRRFSRTRFVRREDFPETLALRELDLRARGKGTELLDDWMRLYREEAPHQVAPRQQSRRPRRRRHPGQRGRPRPSRPPTRNEG